MQVGEGTAVWHLRRYNAFDSRLEISQEMFKI
jgi:hypothetical protein